MTEYSATCEGWTVYMSVELAADQAAAKQAHIARFKMEPFFAQGVVVLDLVTDEPKIVAILGDMFAPGFIDFLRASNYNPPLVPGKLFEGFGSDFAFSFYVNRS